jgi:hypothetical protein
MLLIRHAELANREFPLKEIAQGRADDLVIINQKNSGSGHKVSNIITYTIAWKSCCYRVNSARTLPQREHL